jgi:hypothetical protein
LNIDGWDPELNDVIADGRIPPKPWLAGSVTSIKSEGQHAHILEQRFKLLVTHHALSRLAQRYVDAKTAGDLLIAANNMLCAYLAITQCQPQSLFHWASTDHPVSACFTSVP